MDYMLALGVSACKHASHMHIVVVLLSRVHNIYMEESILLSNKVAKRVA